MQGCGRAMARERKQRAIKYRKGVWVCDEWLARASRIPRGVVEGNVLTPIIKESLRTTFSPLRFILTEERAVGTGPADGTTLSVTSFT